MLLFWLICVPALCVIMAVVEYLTDDVVPRADQTRRRRWPVNFALFGMNVGLALVIPFTSITTALAAEAYGIGLLNILGVPALIGFVVSYLYLSFHAWALHYAFHSFAVLWRFHRVHHSDYDLDLSSAFRNHPVEVLISAATGSAAALVLGLNPFAAVASTMTIMSISIVTHARVTLAPGAERIGQLLLVTPGMHHLHHSDHRPETHSNFGGDFSVWDRMFGTLIPVSLRAQSDFGYGLKSDTPEMADDLDWVLVTPFKRQKHVARPE